jgi:hypothetical protein
LKKDGEEVIANAKVRNSEEIFIVADTIEDAKKVIALNDDIGKAVQKQRFAHLKKHHQVSEGQMPDTQRRLQMEQTNLFKTSMGVK